MSTDSGTELVSSSRREEKRRPRRGQRQAPSGAMWDQGTSDSPRQQAPITTTQSTRSNPRAMVQPVTTAAQPTRLNPRASPFVPQQAQPVTQQQVAKTTTSQNGLSKQQMDTLLKLYKDVTPIVKSSGSPRQSGPLSEEERSSLLKSFKDVTPLVKQSEQQLQANKLMQVTLSKGEMAKLLDLYKDVKPIVRREPDSEFKGVISQSLFMKGGFDIDTLLNIDNLRSSSQNGGSPLVDKYLSTQYRSGIKLIQNEITELIQSLQKDGITIATKDLDRLAKLFDSYRQSEDEFLKTLQVLEEAKAAMSLYNVMGVPEGEDMKEFNKPVELNSRRDYRPLKTLVERANRYLDKIRKSTIKIADVKAALEKLARGDASDLNKLKTQLNLGSKIVS